MNDRLKVCIQRQIQAVVQIKILARHIIPGDSDQIFIDSGNRRSIVYLFLNFRIIVSVRKQGEKFRYFFFWIVLTDIGCKFSADSGL